MTRLSRRTLPATSTAAIAVLSAGRGGAQSSGDPGVMTHILGAEPPTWDFHATQTSFVAQALAPCYSTLPKFDAANHPAIAGDLADCRDVPDDLMTYTFRLKDGITFHDGSACTAEDVKASFDRILTPPPGVIAIRRSKLADIGIVKVPWDGIPEALRLASLAETCDVSIASHSAHGFLSTMMDDLHSAALVIEDGIYVISDLPGWGVDVNEEGVLAHPSRAGAEVWMHDWHDSRA